VSAPFVRIVANDGNSYHQVTASPSLHGRPPSDQAAQSVEAKAGSQFHDVIVADAREMSGLAFMDMVGLSSPEKRAERIHRDRQACIRAIRNGDTYGFGPAMVAECKQIMADQPDFDQVGWGLAERSAYGMAVRS
jgi:hypothetical protein